MDRFQEASEEMIVYQIRSIWHELARLYNDIAAQEDATMAMGFTLLTINPEKGTPVTRIAPRMGMEPNSLSRLLRSMEDKGLIFRRRDVEDRRKVYICLTEKGQEKRLFSLKNVVHFNEVVMNKLDYRDIQGFQEVMRQMKNIILEMKGDE